MTLAGTDGPREISSVDVGTGAVSALRNDARPGLANVPHPKTSIVDIRSFGGTIIPINLYLQADRPGKRPTLVLIHGGPSARSYLHWTPAVAFFTAMGFAVVEPSGPLSRPHVPHPRTPPPPPALTSTGSKGA